MRNLLRDKNFKKILVSYMLILLIPLVMGIAFCIIIGAAAHEQMSGRLISENENIRTYFDSTLSEVTAYGRSLSQNSTLRSYIDIGDESGLASEERISFGEVSSLLNVYSENYIESCEVYYRENRSILRSGSRRTSDFVEAYLMDNYGATESGLLENAGNVSLNIARIDGGWKAYIILPIISSRSYDVSGLLLITINSATVLSEMDAYSQDGSSAFLLYGNVYLSKDYCGEVAADLAPGDSFFSEILGQNVITSTSDSQYGVSVMTTLMTRDYYKPIYRIVWLIAAYFIVCAATGFVYAYRQSRKRYEIFERLSGIVPGSAGGDTIEAIEQSVKNTARIKDSFDRYKKDSVRERFLFNLLVLGSAGAPENLEVFGIAYQYKNYVVVLMEAVNIEDIFHGDEKLDDLEQYESFNVIVRSVFGEISHEQEAGISFVSVSQNVIAAVVNFGRTFDFDSLFTGYSELIEQNFGIKLLCAAGTVVGTVSSFHESYNAALSGLNSLKIMDGHTAGENTGEKDSSGSRIMDFVNENLSNDLLDLNFIANRVGLSNSYISRVFKQYSGLTLHEYINLSRVQKAGQLLTSTDMSVIEIAKAVGYSNTRTLVRAMQKYEGVSPSQYRQMNRYSQSN